MTVVAGGGRDAFSRFSNNPRLRDAALPNRETRTRCGGWEGARGGKEGEIVMGGYVVYEEMSRWGEKREDYYGPQSRDEKT